MFVLFLFSRSLCASFFPLHLVGFCCFSTFTPCFSTLFPAVHASPPFHISHPFPLAGFFGISLWFRRISCNLSNPLLFFHLSVRFLLASSMFRYFFFLLCPCSCYSFFLHFSNCFFFPFCPVLCVCLRLTLLHLPCHRVIRDLVENMETGRLKDTVQNTVEIGLFGMIRSKIDTAEKKYGKSKPDFEGGLK